MFYPLLERIKIQTRSQEESQFLLQEEGQKLFGFWIKGSIRTASKRPQITSFEILCTQISILEDHRLAGLSALSSSRLVPRRPSLQHGKRALDTRTARQASHRHTSSTASEPSTHVQHSGQHSIHVPSVLVTRTAARPSVLVTRTAARPSVLVTRSAARPSVLVMRTVTVMHDNS